MNDTTYIYGKHTVEEAIKMHPHRIECVYVGPHEKEIIGLARKKNVRIESLDMRALSNFEDVNHQHVVALVEVPAPLTLEAFLHDREITAHTALVLLAEIQDPHNVGAIIRSAAAFGVSGILIPERRQSPITGTVAKVSAGMVFAVPTIAIGNINQTLGALKKHGFWIYGLAGEGRNPLPAERFDAPAVFVIGNEGEGLREKTQEHCDIVLSIPMHPQCESLNASASAAAVLYAWSAQHPQALAK